MRQLIYVFVLGILSHVCLGEETVPAGSTSSENPSLEVSTHLIMEGHAFRTGKPIKVSLDVGYTGDAPAKLGSLYPTHAQFSVKDQDGSSVRRVERQVQVPWDFETIRPGETLRLLDGVDLSEQYLFLEPGLYTVQFLGESARTFGGIALPPSNRVQFLLARGRMRPVDRLVTEILPLLSEGWGISKSQTGGSLSPFGRREAQGDLVVIRPVGGKGNGVFLWQCQRRADEVTSPNNAPKRHFPDFNVISQYLGRGRYGYLYLAVCGKAKEAWPTAAHDLSKGLLR